MTYIRKVKTASGATAVQLATKHKGQITNIEHIGSAHTEEELKVLLSAAQKKMHTHQPELFPNTSGSIKVEIKQTYSRLLWETLRREYSKLGFGQLEDEIFESLCLTRIVEPTSKIDSLRVMADLGVKTPYKNKVYQSLKKVVEEGYRETISQACFRYIQEEKLSLVLYDVTSLYFEVQAEDGYRKPGLSKERRLEPQIIIGLLVDKNGFPLGLQSFEGNKAETKTILPVIEAFQKEHRLKKVTVVADAAMLSVSNLAALTQAGYTYIVGSHLNKIPYELAEYQKDRELEDQQILVSQQEGYRIVYQYRTKRAALDLSNIEKQIEKAKKVISGQVPVTRTKFVSMGTQSKQLNQELIEKARALAGIKGYVTNLDIPDEEVIASYHQLFHVEAAFRMTKSDLKARPIYHRKRDSIEAHLTIVLAAMAISRNIEMKTRMSIKQFIKLLRPIRSGLISVNGIEMLAEPEIPHSLCTILNSLSSGY